MCYLLDTSHLLALIDPRFRTAVLLELHDYKKLMTVANDATAFANRGPWYNLTIVMRWKTEAMDAKVRPFRTSPMQRC